MQPEVTEETKEKAASELFAGQKISAVKIWQEATGLSLMEAKTSVESLEAQLRKECPEKFTSQSSGCGSAAVLFLVVAGSVAYCFA